MAIEELNREMVKAQARVEVGQSASLPQCPLKRTNKRFLHSTIKNALTFNRRKGHTTRLKSMKKLVEVEEGHSSDRRPVPSAKRAPKTTHPPAATNDEDEVIVLD